MSTPKRITKLPFVCIGDFAAERTRAYRLMHKHGLTDWLCEIVHLEPTSKRREIMGSCDYVRKTIYLDKEHVLRGRRWLVRETILHEIAHALGSTGHGPHWQRRALSIGVSERGIARYRNY